MVALALAHPCGLALEVCCATTLSSIDSAAAFCFINRAALCSSIPRHACVRGLEEPFHFTMWNVLVCLTAWGSEMTVPNTHCGLTDCMLSLNTKIYNNPHHDLYIAFSGHVFAASPPWRAAACSFTMDASMRNMTSLPWRSKMAKWCLNIPQVRRYCSWLCVLVFVVGAIYFSGWGNKIR